MKAVLRILIIGLYLITFLVLLSSIGSAITKKPLLLTAIRSYSMYPLLERGDAVFIRQVDSGDVIKEGDIIVFTTESGSYASKGLIMHRVVGGNAEDGFITKGDANDYTDQDSGGTGPIKQEWILSKAITIGNYPLKLPLIGYLPLWMENYKGNPYLLPSLAAVIAAIIGISELTDGSKKKKKRGRLELQLIYFFSGLTITVMLGASMLATSQHLTINYEISDSSQGVMMGSSVGILKTGEEVKRPLTELSNKGFFPVIATVISNDTQISFSHDKLLLKPGDEVNTQMIVKAETAGKYNSTIWVGMFFPFLPLDLVYFLAQKSYWLALTVVSFMPGLPVMLYPLIESRMRRKTIKEIRRKIRRIRRLIPV